jgi:hypothetical protein
VDIQKLKGLVLELNNLKRKVDLYKQSNEYIYTNIYSGWIKEYNGLLYKYNAIVELNLNPMACNQWDLSSTQKTVKDATVESFIGSIESISSQIESDIEDDRLKAHELAMPGNQMRRCFKLGLDKCPLNPVLQKNKVFIAMPFDDAYLDSYKYGMIPALDSFGFTYYRADNEISNKDIMCKVCNEIQSCGLAIINISGLNPNVMLEQGLAYGLGKPVMIVKDTNTNAISDLGSIEYIQYSHAYDLMQKLTAALDKYK